MRFATISDGGRDCVVIVDQAGSGFVRLADACPGLDDGVTRNMLGAIAAYDGFKDRLRDGASTHFSAAHKLRAPIPLPRRDIICAGKNYHEHAREFTASGYDSSAQSLAQAIPTAPIIFGKSALSVVGPDDDILLHPGVDQQIDYEAELAVVIGKPGQGIRKADALEHVFGYTIVNDVTARDLQERHKQWYLAKSLDTSCPMGPWIVTADEVDLASDTISCWVDGGLRQQAVLKDMIFDVPTLIEVISAGMRLEPGDIIATGTPAGVAIGFKPPKFLKEGARVDIEVSSIGRLSNTVRRSGAYGALPVSEMA